MSYASKKVVRSRKLQAVNKIKAALSDEFGWSIRDTGDEDYIHISLVGGGGYHELLVFSADFNDGLNGSCVVSLFYGDGEEDAFEIPVLMRGGACDLSQLDAGLRRAFKGGPTRRGLAAGAAERRAVSDR